MSVARGFGLNGKSIYMNVCKPCIVEANFVVDPSNGNGLGIRSLKSNGYIQDVFMNVNNIAGGGVYMGAARSYAILAASAVTSTGSSVLTGNLGIFPGTSITGFPPATFSGVENVANVAASAAKADAQAAYTALQAKTPTGIDSALDGQTLAAGVYKATSGTAGAFTLDAAGGALVLSGSATDIYVFQTTSTLITGTTGAGVITLGDVLPQNIYWVVGSSATLNSATASPFYGNVIAHDSITSTTTATGADTIKGSLIALNGAVTLSDATAITAQALAPAFVAAGNPNPAPGYAMIRMKNNFNKYLGGFTGFVSPLSGSTVTSVVAGQAYVIVSLGTATLAQWQAVGLPVGFVPAVGQSFIAIASQSIGGSGAVQAPAISGVNSVEVIGNPNLLLNNSNLASNAGAILLVQFLGNGVLAPPVANSVCGMSFWFDGSSVTVDGL